MKYEQISECFISVTLIIEIVEKKRMGYTSVSVLGLEDYLIRLYFQSNFFPVSFCSFFYWQNQIQI